MLLVAVQGPADTPATVIGRVVRDGKAARGARVELTATIPKMKRAGVAVHTSTTDDAGRFIVLGLPPAATHAISTRFVDGFYSMGALNDLRSGDVRHVMTTIQTRICGTNFWREEPDRRPQQVFEWPLRDRRNQVWLCE
jgi:hypothetical protein